MCTAEVDEFAWLEDVEAERSLSWVRERNEETKKRVIESAGGQEKFDRLRDDLLAILDSTEKIPYVRKLGHGEGEATPLYNLWKEKDHERGLWRRATLSEYRKRDVAWETVIDVDEMSRRDGEKWTWGGAGDAVCPEYRRCIVSLSRGGADATLSREFDLVEKRFVPAGEGGFDRPESKGGLSWIDKDTVFAFTDFGDGSSMTSSGYPRTVRVWKRGTPMAQAKLLYGGREEDLYISGMHDPTAGFVRDFVSRAIAFYDDELFLVATDGSGKLEKIPVPNDSKKGIHREWLLLQLRSDFEPVPGTRKFPSGALVVARFDEVMSGRVGGFRALFVPTPTTSLESFDWTRNHLILNILDNVVSRIEVLTPPAQGDGEWSRAPLLGAPALGTVSASPLDEEFTDEYLLTCTDYLTPTTLSYGTIGSMPQCLKSSPSFFNSSGLEMSQHFAVSEDGTRVPYFQVSRKDLALAGNAPTLLYGYGGFELSLTPMYNAMAGRAWAEQGGVYVEANIRGGGEFGPAWHQAALREKRVNAYKDMIAVARDLIARHVTSPAHLGIKGGSNGGLMVANVMLMAPELFGAVVCQAPLLDMKRYSVLLAGASWMAEYGDPSAADWESFLHRYSPYHNLHTGMKLPPILLTTSTRDDRVHPGHARKFVAKLRFLGYSVEYWENIEGGHGGSSTNPQAAFMQALSYSFLRAKLF